MQAIDLAVDYGGEGRNEWKKEQQRVISQNMGFID